MKKIIAMSLILTQIACGTRFDIQGVDHEKLLKKESPTTKVQAQETPGCMLDSDCKSGQVCATVKGELPGSCATTGGAGLLVGAAILGAAAAAAANQNNNSGGNYAPGPRGRDVWVNGYYRSDGSYVPGHYRSAPDATRTNNYGSPSRNSTGLYDRDTDGDGIYNQFDYDDDGDGIHDDYEY